LVFSQFITLYITPVVYLYLEAVARRFGTIRIWRRRPQPAPLGDPVTQ
jgi:hypothetical protein